MGVKLVDKNQKAETAEAPTAEAKTEKKQKTVTLNGKKIVPTAGVFMISSPDGKFKYIGTSTRIEVCMKDYFKWLHDQKHGNAEMQKAYNDNDEKLNWTILKVCEKADFSVEKAKACKEHNIDMKIPFSKEVIKAKDIVVDEESKE